MRAGLISDSHGNKVALNAVLADMPPVDTLVCAGDRPVAVAHHRRNRTLTDGIDTRGWPGVVAADVAGPYQRIDRRHVSEDGSECDLGPVATGQ